MMTNEMAWQWAQDWVDAWNAHDIIRVLSHYTPDFEMSSPYIVTIAGEPSGVLRGQAALAAYWRAALEKLPDLQFELREVFRGVNSLTVYYKGARGVLATEVFFFDEHGLVIRAHAHYGEF